MRMRMRMRMRLSTCVCVCVCVYELSRSGLPVRRGYVVADNFWRVSIVFLCPLRMRLSILGRLRMCLPIVCVCGGVCLHVSAYASVYSQPALTGVTLLQTDWCYVTANLCCGGCGGTVGYVERWVCHGRRRHDDCLGRHALLSLQGFSIFKFHV